MIISNPFQNFHLINETKYNNNKFKIRKPSSFKSLIPYNLYLCHFPSINPSLFVQKTSGHL